MTDSLAVRAGDVLSSATVLFGGAVLALGACDFGWINLALVSSWLMVATLAGREFPERVEQAAVQRARQR